MKAMYLFIALILHPAAQACRNKLPMSEVVRAISFEPGAGSVSCEQKPEEECLCYEGVPWEAAEIVDEYINGKEIWSAKENIAHCESESNCEALRLTICSELKDYHFFYSSLFPLPGFEAYCTKLLGHEQVKTGRKILVSNPDKLAAYKALMASKRNEELQGADKKRLLREKLKDFDKTKLTTVAALRDFVAELVELLK
jgi:hypothetical protein